MPDRLEKEIDEILRGTPESEIPEEGSPHKRLGNIRSSRFLSKLNRISIPPGKFMLTSIALLLVIMVLYNSALSNAGPLVWIGVALFGGSYLLFFVNPNKSTPEKRWRGEVIESSSSLMSRVKKWMNK
jgi:hypothetical protein